VLEVQYTRNEHPIKETSADIHNKSADIHNKSADIHNKVACARSRGNNDIAGRFWVEVSCGTCVPMVQTADLVLSTHETVSNCVSR